MGWYIVAFVLSFVSGVFFGAEYVIRKLSKEVTDDIVRNLGGRVSDNPPDERKGVR
jgi:hypothetical protein